MPAGYPGGATNLHQAPPFVTLDALHATPEGRWETLKLLRLLQWLWDGPPGWPPVHDPATQAYVAGLTAQGPPVTPPTFSFPGIAPLGAYQIRYADLVAAPPVRLSRVAQMLNLMHPQIPRPAGYPAGPNIGETSVLHIDEDWFGDQPQPAAPHPFLWKGKVMTKAGTRERRFVDAMVQALDLSLGLDSVPNPGDPITWPDTFGGPDAWPPLQGNPAGVAAKLTAPINSAALIANKPIDHFWDNVGHGIYRLQVLTGAQRVSFVVTTPPLR